MKPFDSSFLDPQSYEATTISDKIHCPSFYQTIEIKYI
jgi:hypothetical protein